MSGPRFCGSCGAPLGAAPQAFCTSCGQRVLSTSPPVGGPVHAPSPLQGSPELLGHGGPAPTADPSRRRWPAVAVGLGVLALVGGGVAAVTLLRGAGAHTVDGVELPSAIGSEPERAWRHDLDGDYLAAAVGVGGTVVLADGEGAVVAVDAHGEDAWTADDRYVAYVVAVPGHDDLVVGAGGEGDGVGALAADDGHELWWRDDGFPAVTTADGLLLAEGAEGSDTADLTWVDPDSGEERWSLDDVGSFGSGHGKVYVLQDGDLSQLDQETGKVEWTAQVPFHDSDYAQITATEGLVAVAGDEVLAFDTGDGAELWTWSPDDPDASLALGAYAEGRIYVAETTYDEDTSESTVTVTVRDRDGVVGDLAVGPDDFFYGTGVESGGTSWFVDLSGNEVYDEELQRVASYDGVVALADTGLYSSDADSVAFHEYGESRPAWELDLPDASEDGRSFFAVDDGLLVVADGEVTAYR